MPLRLMVVALRMRSFKRATCSAVSSRVNISATVLRLAPCSRRNLAASNSAGVVEEKVKEPVSS